MYYKNTFLLEAYMSVEELTQLWAVYFRIFPRPLMFVVGPYILMKGITSSLNLSVLSHRGQQGGKLDPV